MLKKIYFKIIDTAAGLIFHKPKIIGKENLPKKDEVVIYVCNHAAALGPVLTTKYLQGTHRPWIIGYILDKKKAPNYIFHDFLRAEKKKCKWFFKIISHITAFFLVPILKYYRGLPVWHDQRMMSTYRESLNTLENRESLVIFPESPLRYSEYIFEFQSGFVNLALQYYKNTGKEIKFIPLYVHPSPNTILIGQGITFQPNLNTKEYRKDLAHDLTVAVDNLAQSQVGHKNIPFLDKEWFDTYGDLVDDMSKYWKKFD